VLHQHGRVDARLRSGPFGVGPAGLPFGYDVVARRIDRSTAAIGRVIGVVPPRVGALRFDEPFTRRAADRTDGYHARARLSHPGARLARSTRVDIKLTAWSAPVSELRLVPAKRRLARWGRRRQRRYFEQAHRTVDELARWLEAALRRDDVIVVLTRRSFADQRPARRRDGTVLADGVLRADSAPDPPCTTR